MTCETLDNDTGDQVDAAEATDSNFCIGHVGFMGGDSSSFLHFDDFSVGKK